MKKYAIIMLALISLLLLSTNNELYSQNDTVMNDSLYDYSLTGSKKHVELNNDFLQTVIGSLIKDYLRFFCLTNPVNQYIFDTRSFYERTLSGLPVSVGSVNISIFSIWNDTKQLKEKIEYTFDNFGVIYSYKNQDKVNNYNYEYRVKYHSTSQLKFDSINELSYNNQKIIGNKKCIFEYDSSGFLTSIVFYNYDFFKNNFRKESQLYFTYYENGVLVSDGVINSKILKFYSFIEDKNSIIKEVYFDGNLRRKNIIDNNGNLICMNGKNDTISIYSNSYKLLYLRQINNYYWLTPNYLKEVYQPDNISVYNTKGVLQKKYIFKEFDKDGNWTTCQTYSPTNNPNDLLIREINY